MPKLGKAERRDKKRAKRKNGMRTDGKSVFTIQSTLIKRATPKKVTLTYWKDGVQYSRRVSEFECQQWITVLRSAGGSGFSIKRGKEGLTK